MRFNNYLVSHFKACPLLLEYRDHGRQRQVRVFNIDDDTLVGVSDGVESWIAPVANFERFDLRSIMKVKVVQRGTSSVNQRNTHTPPSGRAVLRAVLVADD